MNKKDNNENRKTFIEKYDIQNIKANLLCLGLNVSKKTSCLLDEFFFEHNFIHGSQIFFNGNEVANVPINERFVFKHSPFELIKTSGEWLITKSGSPLIKCKPLLMPYWVNIPLNDSIRIGDLVRPHSNKILFCTLIKRCVFERLEKKCKFCTFSGCDINLDLGLKLIKKAFQIIYSENISYKEVAIGGAAINLEDFGVSYYSKVANAIKEVCSDIKISVEVIPPYNLNLLDDLHSSGIDSIIMNLELFDYEERLRICPGKSSVPQTHYFKAWEKALSIFGENRVSSVLIIGLEKQESSIKGALKMLEMGVNPTLIPFKPYDKCELHYLHPVDPEYYESIYKEIFQEGDRNRINPTQQPGCTRCGGCSLETNIIGKENERDP